MTSTDQQLIELIDDATQGWARAMVTFGRRGKALEAGEPDRAQELLQAVRMHPFYKGGRLTFDMLEIEDLILESATARPMTLAELRQAFQAGPTRLVEVLCRLATQEPPSPAPPDVAVPPGFERDPFRTLARNPEQPAAPADLPLLHLGLDNQGAVDAEWEGRYGSYPQLLPSDYLYDLVVLGLLDVVSWEQARPAADAAGAA